MALLPVGSYERLNVSPVIQWLLRRELWQVYRLAHQKPLRDLGRDVRSYRLFLGSSALAGPYKCCKAVTVEPDRAL